MTRLSSRLLLYNPGRLVRELEEGNPFVWHFRPHPPPPLTRSITTWVTENWILFCSILDTREGTWSGACSAFVLHHGKADLQHRTSPAETVSKETQMNEHGDQHTLTCAHTRTQLPRLHVYLIKWQLALLRPHHPPHSLYDSPDTSWQNFTFFFWQHNKNYDETFLYRGWIWFRQKCGNDVRVRFGHFVWACLLDAHTWHCPHYRRTVTMGITFSIITLKKMQLKQKLEFRAHRPVWKMWVNPSSVQPTWQNVTFSK